MSRLLVLATLLACTGTPAALPAGRSEHTVSVGGTTRHFVVRMPEGMPEGPTHVFLLLHGSTRHASADELAPVRFLEGELQAQAAAWSGRGAALVYLAGRDVGSGLFCWGAGTDNNLCTAPREGKEDETFLLAVLDWLKGHDSAFGTPAVPAYLYGHSGGGRMTWRAACNSTLGPRFAGVFPSSALLAAELRQENEAKCDVSNMPRIFITHGTIDQTTDISFADDSVAWTAVAADCKQRSVVTGIGQDPSAELELHKNCSKAKPDFEIAYYRLQNYPHRVPPTFYYDTAWAFLVGGDQTATSASSTPLSQTSLSLSATAGAAAATTAAASHFNGSVDLRYQLGLVIMCMLAVVLAQGNKAVVRGEWSP